MKKTLTFLFLLFISTFGFSQNKHIVTKGETVYSISKKYNVTSAEIIKLNPTVKNGVQENSEIILPKNAKISKPKTKLNKFEYQVLQGETLYSISKKLGVSVNEIIKNNPTAKESVSAGQMLVYFAPEKYVSKQTSENNVKPTQKEVINIHTILPEETKYSVSKKYGISISELEELNPHIKDVFEIGMQIRLNKNTQLPNFTAPKIEKPETTKTMFYTVQQGETLFSISKRFGITVDEILKRNPTASSGLTAGTELLLPEKKDVNPINFPNDESEGEKKN